MVRASFIGTWEVVKCEHDKSTYIGSYYSYIKYMEGIKFRLEENGDVTWFINDELKSVPLFSCETYEIYGNEGIVIHFGAYAGHIFEFIPNKSNPVNKVTLTCEGLCVLHCTRCKDEASSETEASCSVPYFTLLSALEDGYFSDITITASNNKQFKVHSTILELQADDIDWTSDALPFNNIPEDVLGTILHFLYSECLPDNLTEETARQVVTVVSPYPSLYKLVDNCELYLKNIALKQQIIGLVNDMHSCLNEIIDRFHTRNNHSSMESITSNPAKLCFVVKQSIRDAAVAGAKLLLLFDLFTKRKNELSKKERNEIIRYARSRLPVFLSQITRFVQALKDTFTSMSPSQRVEIASFLVPEIETILDTMSMLIVHVEKALQQIIQSLFVPDTTKSKSVGDMLSKTVLNLLHKRELTKLNTLHEHITCSLGLLVHKKENFGEMSSAQKVRSIARNLEQSIEELPLLLITLEEMASAFEERLEWSDFKFCFKIGTSGVSDILQKLRVRTDSLQDVMSQVCELVQRDAFTHTLQSLGLLNTTASSSSHPTETLKTTRSSSHATPKHHAYKLNLVESLCVPPNANDSRLSELCLELLNSEKQSDMVFEIIGNSFGAEQSEERAAPEEKCIIKSHRVIVATRCDWFRRALLSGMKEAIDKKIVIHDTSPFLFRILLEYLYSGKLKQDSLSTEQLVEILLLSDRYEMDCLKVTCENALLSSVDEESVFYFLSMSDQYNARVLKTRCLNFISQHHELTENEEFFELPISLQAEIFDSVWTQPTTRQSDMLDYGLEHLLPTSSSASNNSFHCTSPGVNESRNSVDPELDRNRSNNSSLEDLRLQQSSSQMERCINQLREIVSEATPREVLVQIILAADYDLRRAVNYYYVWNSEDE
ncbi:hypothetical protein NQ315_003733 [Exocentrus adspersus]|uniref:BTB domain-containing protein n=1 Tax=Exocentrus adspersus TaxID=1586481 RepID=A0AAV8VI14_9CUCU|nr:hypothetical protein NQ315_003733 [Exocentrus adspersus]